MKTKKKKYLPLYEKWMETGEIPFKMTKKTRGGLCSIFPKDKVFNLMKPEHYGLWYWGHSEYMFNGDALTFTPLRQTIVLFMCALNDEL